MENTTNTHTTEQSLGSSIPKKRFPKWPIIILVLLLLLAGGYWYKNNKQVTSDLDLSPSEVEELKNLNTSRTKCKNW